MQTKLTPDEKREVVLRLDDFAEACGEVYCFRHTGLTLAILPNFKGSRFATIGVAWQSPSEKKFRELVGADLAMARCINSGMPVHFHKGETAAEFARRFADFFGKFELSTGNRM